MMRTTSTVIILPAVTILPAHYRCSYCPLRYRSAVTLPLLPAVYHRLPLFVTVSHRLPVRYLHNLHVTVTLRCVTGILRCSTTVTTLRYHTYRYR